MLTEFHIQRKKEVSGLAERISKERPRTVAEAMAQYEMVKNGSTRTALRRSTEEKEKKSQG